MVSCEAPPIKRRSKSPFTPEELVSNSRKVGSNLICPHDREDAQQEWVIGALEAERRGNGKDTIRSYQRSYGSGKMLHFLIDYLFPYKKREKTCLGLLEVTEVINESEEEYPTKLISSDNVFENVVNNERTEQQKKMVRRCLSKLSKNQRLIIRERFFKNASVKEVGSKLGVTHQAVSKGQNLALAKIRIHLFNSDSDRVSLRREGYLVYDEKPEMKSGAGSPSFLGRKKS